MNTPSTKLFGGGPTGMGTVIGIERCGAIGAAPLSRWAKLCPSGKPCPECNMGQCNPR